MTDTYCDCCGKWLTEQVLIQAGLFCEDCWEGAFDKWITSLAQSLLG
jgi:hypothetical protein